MPHQQPRGPRAERQGAKRTRTFKSTLAMHLIAMFTVIVGVVEAEEELLQVLFRHGDRAPSQPYPEDAHSADETWPNGWSQLTERGFSQCEELGSFLRARYYNMAAIHERKRVYARSSAKERCIESAMGVLQGMMPAQRIPIHTYSHHWLDLLLKPNSVRCDRYKELVSGDKRGLWDRMDRRHETLFAHISNHTGWTVGMHNVKHVYNAVYREAANELEQPAWTETLYEGERVFDWIVELKRQDRMAEFDSEEKSLLMAGYLLDELVNNMIEKTDGRADKYDIRLYATHDATITALLHNMGVSDNQLPPYAAAILFELHRRDDGTRYVEVLYRNSTSSAPVRLRAAGCSGTQCSLEEFLSVSATRVLTRQQFHARCSLPIPRPPTRKPFGWRRSSFHIDLPALLSVAIQLSLIIRIYFSLLEKEYQH